jgi:hypothetical protein
VEPHVAQLQPPCDVTSSTASGEITTDDSVSSTSTIRSAQTAARGIIAAMKLAIITDIRICARYVMNAISDPTDVNPHEIRSAPIHSAATVDT